jgi:lipopolysaccharide exporter
MFSNVDYAIIAARLSAAQTGIYWRAFNLGVVYQQKISGVMMQVAFPVYSRTESREQLRGLHARATRVHAAVIFPLLALLIVLAPVLIPFVFGEPWEPAVVPAQILAVAGMVAAILTGYPQIMLAVGRPKALLRFNVGMLAVYAGAITLAAPHGLVAVSITAGGAYLAILVGVYRFLLAPNLDMGLGSLVEQLGPAAGASLALGGVALAVREALAAASAPPWLVLAVAGSVGLAAYAVALRALFRATWDDLRMMIDRVLPKLGKLALRLRGARAAPATTP